MRETMALCQHEDCERDGIVEWNGCVFCDEHVRERLRTVADEKAQARIREPAAMNDWTFKIDTTDGQDPTLEMELYVDRHNVVVLTLSASGSPLRRQRS